MPCCLFLGFNESFRKRDINLLLIQKAVTLSYHLSGVKAASFGNTWKLLNLSNQIQTSALTGSQFVLYMLFRHCKNVLIIGALTSDTMHTMPVQYIIYSNKNEIGLLQLQLYKKQYSQIFNFSYKALSSSLITMANSNPVLRRRNITPSSSSRSHS